MELYFSLLEAQPTKNHCHYVCVCVWVWERQRERLSGRCSQNNLKPIFLITSVLLQLFCSGLFTQYDDRHFECVSQNSLQSTATIQHIVKKRSHQTRWMNENPLRYLLEFGCEAICVNLRYCVIRPSSKPALFHMLLSCVMALLLCIIWNLRW